MTCINTAGRVSEVNALAQIAELLPYVQESFGFDPIDARYEGEKRTCLDPEEGKTLAEHIPELAAYGLERSILQYDDLKPCTPEELEKARKDLNNIMEKLNQALKNGEDPNALIHALMKPLARITSTVVMLEDENALNMLNEFMEKLNESMLGQQKPTFFEEFLELHEMLVPGLYRPNI